MIENKKNEKKDKFRLFCLKLDLVNPKTKTRKE